MRYTRWIKEGFLFAVLSCFLFATPAAAVDKIDSEFGDSGFIIKDFGFGDDEAFALAVQPDGKILVAGYSSNGAVKNLSVARYLVDGTLDISFNYDGLFTHSMGSGDTIARSIVVQDNGRIIVAGSSYDIEPALAVVALTSDGYLDAGFGDNGQLVLPIHDEDIVTTDLKIAVDGSIIVGATVEGADSISFPLVVKINSEGEFVSEFGEDGILRYEQDYGIEIHSLVLLDGGKILFAGAIEQDEIMQAGLLRLNEDGTTDSSFGNKGELLLEMAGEGSVINDLWAEPEGRVLVAGAVDNGQFRQAFAALLDKDGQLEPSFAGSGLFKSNIEYDNVAHAITVQQDGTIVLAGFGSSDLGKDLIIWNIAEKLSGGLSEDELILDAEQQIVLRPLLLSSSTTEPVDTEYEKQQEQESEFVTTHIVTDIANGNDIGYAIAALETGQVLTVGSAGNGTDKDFVLVRFTSDDLVATLAAGSSTGGVDTGDLRVITMPVVDITRVGAVSGGNIFITSTMSCETSCTAECRDFYDNDDMSEYSCQETDIYTKCFDPCQDERTIIARGVVFSVYQNPIYRSGNTISLDNDDSYIYETVRDGQTSDGEGLGVYPSDIQGITPNVTYYIRAYGMMADDTDSDTDNPIIYGNQLTFKTKDACFIATAAYGTILDGHVTLLRQFRDTYLMSNGLGRKIVGIYYHYSPQIADIVSENTLLRNMVRIALWPFVGFALFMLNISSIIKIIGILIGVLAAGFYWKPKTCVQKY